MPLTHICHLNYILCVKIQTPLSHQVVIKGFPHIHVCEFELQLKTHG